jgi:hypothetical protein
VLHGNALYHRKRNHEDDHNHHIPQGGVMNSAVNLFQLLSMLIRALAFTAVLFVANACAQSPTSPENAVSSTSSSRDQTTTWWIGTYDEAFGKKSDRPVTSFTVSESTLRWGTHDPCRFREVTKSEKQFALEIVSHTKCGWRPGNVIFLDVVARGVPLAVDVYVYQNVNELKNEIHRTRYQRKHYMFHAAYVKR